MEPDGFGFHIEVHNRGALVGRRHASLAPCHEDALFRAIVAGRAPNDGTLPDFAIRPIWKNIWKKDGEEDGGEPRAGEGDREPNPSRISGIEFEAPGVTPIRYPVEIFDAQARAFMACLLAERAFGLEDPVEWSVVAEFEPQPPLRHDVRVSRRPLPLSPARLPELGAGERAARLDPQLLALLRDGYRAAGAVERAWLLVGSVDCDLERAASSVHALTAVNVLEGPGGASQTHFAFDPALFVEARRRAEREFDGLVPVGWAHSHPTCEACPATPTCPSDTRFFSSDDVEVHSSAFPSPFMLGLVVGKAATAPATEPGFRLYGWRDAQVKEISYQVPHAGR